MMLLKAEHNSRFTVKPRTHSSSRRMKVELLRTQCPHDCVEDAKLKCCQCTDHYTPSPETLGAQLDHTGFLRDVQHATGNGTIASGTSFVHLGQECVCRVRYNR